MTFLGLQKEKMTKFVCYGMPKRKKMQHARFNFNWNIKQALNYTVPC